MGGKKTKTKTAWWARIEITQGDILGYVPGTCADREKLIILFRI
jgi:hypothetical protein